MAGARRGRPTDYTTELGIRICTRLLDGDSIRKIAEDDDFPAKSTILLWAANNKEFSDLYARTREMQGEGDADDVADYSRKAANGEIEPAAATAAIQGLKWVAGKRNRRFSDKVAHIGGGPGDPPIRHELDLTGLSDEELEALEAIRSKLAVPGGDQGGEGSSEA